MKCQRAWELSHVHKLERDKDTDKEAMILGSAFHAGMAHMLENAHVQNYYNDVPRSEAIQKFIKAAVYGLREFMKVETKPNVTTTLADGVEVIDQSYYDMMTNIQVEVIAMFEYYVPLLGLGTRYIVADYGQLFPHILDISASTPLIEFEIDLVHATPHRYRGFVDVILFDQETDEFIVVDWKTRASVLSPDEALLDNQLHVYAAMLEHLDIETPIAQVCMWQFRRKTPRPARINKNGSLSIAVQDTTYTVWFRSLPEHLQLDVVGNQAEWDDFAEAKLSPPEKYMLPVFAFVTERANELAYANFMAKSQLLAEAREKVEGNRGFILPATYTSQACKMCEFRRLCIEALRYGDDPRHIIETDYRLKGEH
jgi:hypothetical protein